MFSAQAETVMGEKGEIMAHEDIPLLEFVEHFDFLYFHAFVLIDVLVITVLRICITFCPCCQARHSYPRTQPSQT